MAVGSGRFVVRKVTKGAPQRQATLFRSASGTASAGAEFAADQRIPQHHQFVDADRADSSDLIDEDRRTGLRRAEMLRSVNISAVVISRVARSVRPVTTPVSAFRSRAMNRASLPLTGERAQRSRSSGLRFFSFLAVAHQFAVSHDTSIAASASALAHSAASLGSFSGLP